MSIKKKKKKLKDIHNIHIFVQYFNFVSTLWK